MKLWPISSKSTTRQGDGCNAICTDRKAPASSTIDWSLAYGLRQIPIKGQPGW